MTSTEPEALVGQVPGAGSAFAGQVTSNRVSLGDAKVAGALWMPTLMR